MHGAICQQMPSGVLTEMQKNLATVQRPPLILLGLLLGPTGPGPDMLVF